MSNGVEDHDTVTTSNGLVSADRQQSLQSSFGGEAVSKNASKCWYCLRAV